MNISEVEELLSLEINGQMKKRSQSLHLVVIVIANFDSSSTVPAKNYSSEVNNYFLCSGLEAVALLPLTKRFCFYT